MNVLTKTLRIAAALLFGIASGCSRKAEQVAPPPPEVTRNDGYAARHAGGA